MAAVRRFTEKSFCSIHNSFFSKTSNGKSKVDGRALHIYICKACLSVKCGGTGNGHRKKKSGMLCETHGVEFNSVFSKDSVGQMRWRCVKCIGESQRKRQIAHPEIYRARSLVHYKRTVADPIKLKAKNERNASWARDNPEKACMYAHNRRIRLANATGKYTVKEWEQVKAMYDYKCIDCGESKKLTVGHAIPISVDGTSNWITNIIPQCISCNVSQHTRIHPSVGRDGLVDRRYRYGAT